MLSDLVELTEKQINELNVLGHLKNKNKNDLLNKFLENNKMSIDSDILSDFKFIDLFCGVGGLSLPFYKSGAKCVFACDVDKYARKTYFRNYNLMPFGDIRAVDTSKLPSFDIIFAGFPCQPYSSGGGRLGLKDDRGSVVNELFRIINDTKPKYLILENVKNIASVNGGNDLKYILGKLDELNYDVNLDLINSNDNGSIQSRERVFFFCSRKDLKISGFKFLNGSKKNKRELSEILEVDYDEKYIVSEKMKLFFKSHKENSLKKGNGFGYCLFNGNETKVSTLTSRYYKDGKEIIINIGNGGMRKLTPSEAFKLQNFPDDFKMDVVSDTQLYKQAGNSVDQLSANVVLNSFIRFILKK